jgi:transcriptional regulator with XRE-family HTH domain
LTKALPTEADIPFSEYVRHRREALGLLQSDLARISGLSKGHLSFIEAGKGGSPTLATIRALADGLGVTVAELVSVAPVPDGRPTALVDAYQRIAELEETIRALSVHCEHAAKALGHGRAAIRRAKVLKE